MNRYRWYSNTHWGPCYDPARKAHFASADDVETLRKTYGPIDAQSLQVYLGDAWHWVTEAPVHLGGIAKHWHGEPT